MIKQGTVKWWRLKALQYSDENVKLKVELHLIKGNLKQPCLICGAVRKNDK